MHKQPLTFLLLVIATLWNSPVAFCSPASTITHPEDSTSAQQLITAYYDCISGPIGEVRDFDRLRSLFHPEARLIYSYWDEKIEQASLMLFTVEEFIGKLDYLDKKGFYEEEISNEIHTFGSVIQVFSTYKYRAADKSIPDGRGITSYELFYDGSRYWIMSMFWNAENEKYQIPAKYDRKGHPENADALYLDKVKTLDATIATLYDVISGPAGEKRNWDLFHYLFKPDAQLIPSGANKAGKIGSRYLSPADYQQSSGKWLEENGFFEREISREVQTFGNITHVFSTYEAFRKKEEETPFMRGINSIQLLHDGNRWWIINIYWTGETDKNKIPEQYLKKR